LCLLVSVCAIGCALLPECTLRTDNPAFEGLVTAQSYKSYHVVTSIVHELILARSGQFYQPSPKPSLMSLQIGKLGAFLVYHVSRGLGEKALVH